MPIEVQRQEVTALLHQEELLELIKTVLIELVEVHVQHHDIIVHHDLINTIEIPHREAQHIEVAQALQEEVLVLEQLLLEPLLTEVPVAEHAAHTAPAQEVINLIEARHPAVAAIVEDQAVVAIEVLVAEAQAAVRPDHLAVAAADHLVVALQVEEDSRLAHQSLFKKKKFRMKRNFTFIALFLCAIITAQNSTDVLRYSSENLQGTARFQGMSGAFGALGGDLSALNVNPAGTSVFNTNQATISGSYYDRSNTINYGGTSSGAYSGYVDINQAGGVLVFKSSSPDTAWSKIAVAINYDVVEDFDNEIVASGNTSEGIDNYFLNFANGVPFGDILLRDGEFLEDAYLDIGEAQGFKDQQAFLGYFGGIIDPVSEDNDNTSYLSNASYSNVNQQFSRFTSGYNSKFTFNVASQYRDILHIGGSLNFHNISYTRFDKFSESNYNADSEIQRTTFDNRLFSEGSGFSLNVGAIAKVSDMVRLGASYQSPTWYRITDNLQQRISSDLADQDINFINFDLVNVFPTYSIKTPAKLTGSLALIFGKSGLLSLDYGYQDMSQAILGKKNSSEFSDTNTFIANDLGGVSTFRLGGEYRIERVSLRAGYRFESSPFNDGSTIGDLESVSGGVGYDFGSSRLDFALNRTERNVAEFLFDTGLNTPAAVNAVRTNATLSYTMRF